MKLILELLFKQLTLNVSSNTDDSTANSYEIKLETTSDLGCGSQS